MNQGSRRMRLLAFCVALVLVSAYFLFTPPTVDNTAAAVATTSAFFIIVVFLDLATNGNASRISLA